jgi:hypothetical protein
LKKGSNYGVNRLIEQEMGKLMMGVISFSSRCRLMERAT